MQTQNAYFISEWLAFAISVLSLCCTLATLFIIKLMKKKSGYVYLISTMTIFQLLFDLNYILSPMPSYTTCVMWNFLYFFGGLGNSYTSNVITFTMLYVITNIQSFNIHEHAYYISSFCIFIPLIIGILGCVVIQHQNDDDLPYQYCIFNQTTLAKFVNYFFYWSRIVSILFNFIAFLYISYEMNRMTAIAFQSKNRPGSYKETNVGTNTGGSSRNDKQVDAIFVLAMRLKYYPLAQSICLVGSAWDEFMDYSYNSDASMFAASITAPLSGVFYFIIFLVMQPNARNTVIEFFSQLTRPSGISTQSLHTHNTHTSNSNFNGAGGEYDPSKSMNFRDSISNIDESDLEAIINQVKEESAATGTLPLQWTSNPVRESQASESRSSKAGTLLYPAVSTERKVSGYYSENSLY